MSLHSTWETHEQDILNQLNQTTHYLLSLLSPQPPSNLTDAHSIHQTNQALLRDTYLHLPKWYSAGSPDRVQEFFNQEKTRRFPNHARLLDPLKERQPHVSRVPDNLMRSALALLEKIFQLYEAYWTSKESAIEKLSRCCTELGKACCVLHMEQICSGLVPSLVVKLESCESNIATFRQTFDPSLEKLKNLLLISRRDALATWQATQRPLTAAFAKALSRLLQKYNQHELLSEIRHAWSQFDTRLNLYLQDPTLFKNSGTYVLKQLFVDWLDFIHLLTQAIQELVNGFLSPSQSIVSSSHRKATGTKTTTAQVPHSPKIGQTSATSIFTKSAPNGMDPSYQQFRQAYKSVHNHESEHLGPLSKEYKDLKQLYEGLSTHLRSFKEKRAQIVGDPAALNHLLQATRGSTLIRPELHHLVQSNQRIDEIERAADEVHRLLTCSIIPSFTDHADLLKDLEQSHSFILQLPLFLSQWSSWVADESRVVRALNETIFELSQQVCLQRNLFDFHRRSECEHLRELHQTGLDHILASMRKHIGDTELELLALDRRLKDPLQGLWALLSQTQQALADQPNTQAQEMAQSLLVNQKRCLDYIEDMQAFHHDFFLAGLWVSSEALLLSIQQFILSIHHQPMLVKFLKQREPMER